MNIESNAGIFSSRPRVTLASLLIVAAFFLCAQTALRAQSVNATLNGTATDQRGALVPGVTIRITNPDTGFQREVQTSDNGTFTFPALPPATYVVSANKDGFAPAEISNLTLNVNDNRSLRIEMRVGQVGETVTVNDQPALINTSSAQATTIDRTFVANLPLNGRSFQSLILLSPGVVVAQSNANRTPGQFSVNGQRTNSNYFTVDGVGANTATNLGSSDNATGILGQSLAGTLPGYSALGTTSTLAPVDAVEEFKIQTSTYSAEFGRQPGGQVQIVTRSGANDFHGSIYDYVRNEKFDANNFFNNANGIERQPLRQNQFGGTFSGPLILPRFGEGGRAVTSGKKGPFFFFAYEGLRLRLPSFENILVPSIRLRQVANPALQPILNAFPLPTGPEETVTNLLGEQVLGGARFIGGYSDPKSSDTYSLRIDYNLTGKLRLFGRYSDTPSSDALRSLSILNSRQVRARSLTLGSTFVLGSNFTNELNFNYSQNRGRLNQSIDNFGGAVPIDPSLLYSGYSGPGPKFGSFSLSFLGGTQIGLGDAQDSFQRQINIVDNVSLLRGNHQFRFGVDYRRLMPTFAPYSFGQTSLILLGESPLATLFFGADEISSGSPLITTIVANQGAEPRFNNYSFYGEDTWKTNKRLTINLGLRYEINPAPYDANGRQPIVLRGIKGVDASGATLAPDGTPFYKTFYSALAPRFGAVYQLSNKPGRETLLRGGFGVFYDLAGAQALNGFSSFPFQSSTEFNSRPYTLPPALAVPPPFPTVSLPITGVVNATDPNLKLPYTLQWNFGIERSLGKDQVISVSYVASAGRRLTTTLFLNNQIGGGLTGIGRFPNPNFNSISYTTNGPTSDYKSLQAQFQRRLTKGLQALANYTFSHATDVVSDEVTIGEFEKGNASFDVRHNFSAALTYELPRFGENRFVNAMIHGFAIDSTIYAESGQPINILAAGRTLADGTIVNVRPDRVEGVPFWIDAPVPGGRRINRAAFALPPRDATGNLSRQGTLGRNEVYGPGIFQVNMGVRREFGLYERLRLQLRAEAFNLFNRPQFSNYQVGLGQSDFGIPISTLNTSLGGGGGLNQLYQLGGPRSLQFSARFFF